MYENFRPGKDWYDTEGKKIQAHGGSLLYADGKFYWYGENKEGVTGRATGKDCNIWHNGVRLYSSNDLYNWKDEGVILVDYQDKNSPFYPGCIMDRPHIVYNAHTKKFVLWAKIAGLLHGGEGFLKGYFAVYSSDKITGPYTCVRRVDLFPAGDFDILKDGETAYIIFEKPHTEMLCAALSKDYTDIAGEISSHLPRPYPPYTREAPAYFERSGRKFLLTSGTTGYFPNQSEIAEIVDFHGEWKDLGNACVGDVNKNSFHAQFSSVFKHPLKEDLYIALGDRWLTDLTEDLTDMCALFEEECSGKQDKNYNFMTEIEQCSDENTESARYVWLPLYFDESGRPYLKWRRCWSTDEWQDKK